jgi:hypothetical protein
VIARREREEVVRVLTNGATCRRGAAEMATRRCSTEAAGGAPMERWFWVRGCEIRARVGAGDNEGAIIAPFIEP